MKALLLKYKIPINFPWPLRLMLAVIQKGSIKVKYNLSCLSSHQISYKDNRTHTSLNAFNYRKCCHAQCPNANFVWDGSRWWDRAVHLRKKENNTCLVRSGTKISVTAQNCGLAAGDKNTLYSNRHPDHANNNKTTTWAKQRLKVFIKDNMMRRYTQRFSAFYLMSLKLFRLLIQDPDLTLDLIWMFSMMRACCTDCPCWHLPNLASSKWQMNSHHNKWEAFLLTLKIW